MEQSETQVLVGTGGWEHEAFDQAFYPKSGLSSTEKLQYYSRFFDAVEIRPTSWDGALTAQDASAWAGAVADRRNFRFTVKLHSSFTHAKEFRTQYTRNARGILQELAARNRLGALLMQFPYSFTNTGSNRMHLIRLAEIFSGFPARVELRHESWNQTSLPGFLAEHGLLPVSADLPRIRQFMPFLTGVVGDEAYLRLHGRNEKGWLLDGMDTRYDYLYNSREVRELTRRIDALSQRCKRITVICNNTTNAKAVANAFQLTAAWRHSKALPIPVNSLRAFPQLGDIAQQIEPPLFEQAGYREAM
jgi:uncharacterized protein YecE (DUF72 family)